VGEFLDRYEPIERSIERKRETINAATSRELDNLRTQLALLDKNKKNKELDAVDLNTRIKGEQQSVVEQIAVVEEKIEQALGENIKIQT
jgi:biopolymer transport protein ExbD